MNNVADKKLRKTLIRIIFTMTLAIASVFLVSSYIANDFQKQNEEINANLVGYLVENYDLNENEIIAILEQQNNDYEEIGFEIFDKYGIETWNITSNLQNKMIMVYSIVILLFTLVVFLLTYIYLVKLDSSISNISKYINRLLNKDYSLDIIDNNEGSLSALKNDIYKITVIL